MRKFAISNVCVAVVLCSSALSPCAGQDLMITGIADGTLPGGEPKFVELYAISDIADLSQYALARASNGSTTFDSITPDYILPSVSLNAGDFYYAVGNSFVDQTDMFDLVFPDKTGIRSRNFGVNSNGDDVTGLFFDSTGNFPGDLSTVTFIDVVGELGIDGTGTDWEHLDSYLYSNNDRTPSTTFNVNDWIVPGINVLDNLDAAGIANEFPDMTFSPTVSTADADFDDDFDVDGDDLATWQTGYGGLATETTGDADGDGDGDGQDFLIWQQTFTGPAGITAVPEPTTSLLLAVGLCLVSIRQRS